MHMPLRPQGSNIALEPSEQEVPLGTRFYNFQPPYTEPIPSNSPPLEPYTLVLSDVNRSVIKQTAKISTPGIAIVSMLHGFSRQRRTIGSFSATAWQLVTAWYCIRVFVSFEHLFIVLESTGYAAAIHRVHFACRISRCTHGTNFQCFIR